MNREYFWRGRKLHGNYRVSVRLTLFGELHTQEINFRFCTPLGSQGLIRGLKGNIRIFRFNDYFVI